MFRTWFFTEMPYPYLPPEESYDSIRATLPNRIFDPETGYQLYEKCFDLYAAADELGLDIMLNEHHTTATCVDSAVPLSMAIVARETKRARILALGNPIASRPDPVRIAEEMAMIDVISRGRAEVGFVRSVPMEVAPGNTFPVDMKVRFWEAAELILKAWTSHDGPFNWESEHYHYRQVNIWPRPFQQPHPPVWVPTQSASTVVEVARRGVNLGTMLAGAEGARSFFDLYRATAAEAGHGAPSREQLAYCALVYVGDTDEEGYEGARRLQWYLQTNKVAEQFIDVPGYHAVADRARILARRARGEGMSFPVAHLAHAPVEEIIEDGYFFAGNPDSVFTQLKRFYERVGGFGNLLLMGHAGTMSFGSSYKSMRLFAEEVLPRFRAEVYDAAEQPEPVAA
jgi:alkanesulfonate monooxygenase SsuD/methylene tetrahydromethanopterin reductase-like flavin-dependent oxidoreductase (luciferase family)